MLNTPNPVLSGSLPPAFPLTPPSLSHFSSASADALDRQMLQHGPLPRNLYVMGLPLDLTQLQFRNLFSSNGMVEHSALLSQLDGLGRRRGFVLMSTHAEANAAMNAMHGRMIDGFKIDVSWALVQREAKHFTSSPYGSMSNRVVHPPSTPIRREPAVDCSVVVENLDRTYFPSANCIREIFANFGPIARVTILPTDNLEVIIQFEHPVSAAALLNANGLSLGGRSLVTRRFIPTPHSMSQLQPQIPTPPQTAPRAHFDPFAHESDSNIFQRERGILSLLNANSEPFVPPSRMGTRAPTQESDSPSMDDLGSSQSGQASSSSKSKKSHEMRSAPTGLENSRGRDFWHKSTPWCECAQLSELTEARMH
ncbi:hypothetical protein M231_05225 [Tremella mesenterica]|uniref:RRM domain-containing protein n=1 Tax=Tremella mesenterica TaxID=5217 RepID=A0A4Q1BIM9_TREME|nr:hypothetical protein M231_05225 [Tremella mesenterica]